MPARIAMPLSLFLGAAYAQQVFCPAKAAASCRASMATAVLTGEDEPLELMQVKASAKRVGGIMASPAKKQTPVWMSTTSDMQGMTHKEKLTGIWSCKGSYATGTKTVQFIGDNLTIHDSCQMWEATYNENDGIHITGPAFAAGVVCDVGDDGFLICSNHDNCSKLDFPVESLKAADDANSWLGEWAPADDMTKTFMISMADSGEFFWKHTYDNVTGFVHLMGDGYWQADACDNGMLAGAASRFKLSKSGRQLMAQVFLPGFTDWSGSIVHKRPDADHKGFPFTLVAVPLIVLMFGVPASCFWLNMEGYPQDLKVEDAKKAKLKASQTAAAKALAREARSIFVPGEDMKYEEAASDEEAK